MVMDVQLLCTHLLEYVTVSHQSRKLLIEQNDAIRGIWYRCMI